MYTNQSEQYSYEQSKSNGSNNSTTGKRTINRIECHVGRVEDQLLDWTQERQVSIRISDEPELRR
jgi:hypothetical protein